MNEHAEAVGVAAAAGARRNRQWRLAAVGHLQHGGAAGERVDSGPVGGSAQAAAGTADTSTVAPASARVRPPPPGRHGDPIALRGQQPRAQLSAISGRRASKRTSAPARVSASTAPAAAPPAPAITITRAGCRDAEIGERREQPGAVGVLAADAAVVLEQQRVHRARHARLGAVACRRRRKPPPCAGS